MEDEGNRQVSQKLKALEQSQKQLTTIIIGGAHDNCSHVFRFFHAFGTVLADPRCGGTLRHREGWNGWQSRKA